MAVTQLAPNPTNKLTAAMVASFAVELLKLIISNVWPDWYNEALFVAMSPIAIIAVGYFIKDEANVSVPTVVHNPDEGK